ncbi:hypothetical protein Q2941_47330 [Bradyrhizobium sp. UFLA05-153]
MALSIDHRDRSEPSASNRSRFASLRVVSGLAKRTALILERPDSQQAFIPTSLQLAGYQAMVGIDGLIVPTSTSGLIAPLLQSQLKLMQLLGVLTRASMAASAALNRAAANVR